jgi:hypothetical protein
MPDGKSEINPVPYMGFNYGRVLWDTIKMKSLTC